MLTYEQRLQAERQVPGETIVRTYRAFEGDIRVITQDASGRQRRYTTAFDEEGNVTLTEM